MHKTSVSSGVNCASFLEVYGIIGLALVTQLIGDTCSCSLEIYMGLLELKYIICKLFRQVRRAKLLHVHACIVHYRA